MTRFPSVADLESHAHRRIAKFAWDYLAGGAGDAVEPLGIALVRAMGPIDCFEVKGLARHLAPAPAASDRPAARLN